MSKLLVHSKATVKDGPVLEVTPESAGWEYVGFAVHRLAAGEGIEKVAAGRETCVVILSGKINFSAMGTGSNNISFENLGSRDTVFDDLAPDSIYVPADTPYKVVAQTATEVALCSAPGFLGGEVRVIKGADVSVEHRGKGSNTRIVRNILPETEVADSLLIAEVITPSGNWSSYPPHKHDSDNLPQESALEETYYHRLNPPQGFAFQRVYTDDRSLDETMSVVDGDVVLVPEGYHPVGAPHGYDLYYLNVMAGPKRAWVFANDPEHDWIAKA